MRWEIPQATELRFGMEITLYIARRWAGYRGRWARAPCEPRCVV